MVYLLPDLEYPVENQPQFNDSQAIWIVFTAYFCILMFLLLLAFALYNTRMYLIKQGKWRVFSLSSFYALTIICTMNRVYVCLMTIRIARWFNVCSVLFPVVIKMCIGLIQIAVIVEITVRVRESISMLSVLNQRQRSRARNFMNEVIASQKRADRNVFYLQILVSVFIVSITICSLTLFIREDHRKYDSIN